MLILSVPLRRLLRRRAVRIGNTGLVAGADDAMISVATGLIKISVFGLAGVVGAPLAKA